MDLSFTRAERQQEDGISARDKRTPFEHDRDRVLYASSFRRLSGITQVASTEERHPLHNRLTHSLKVAQLARRMAEHIIRSSSDDRFLELINPDVAETAGLIHDIGHPPFGHATEKALDDLMEDAGGFEGNAQSFRVVTRLATRKEGESGLDLSRATLNASLKYPCCRGCKQPPSKWTDRHLGKKWGVYEDDFRSYEWVRSSAENICHKHTPAPKAMQRAAEAILVDWADDVSYATHDIEDYYRAGLIPLHDLRNHWKDIRLEAHERLQSDLGDSFDSVKFDEAAKRLYTDSTTLRPYMGSKRQRALIRTKTSHHIMRYVDAITASTTPPYISIPDEEQYEVEVLKTLTRHFVINTPGLLIAQRGQIRVVETLYSELLQIIERSSSGIPRELRELMDGDEYGVVEPRRAVCDYIAGLTEAQAVDLHGRLTQADGRTSFIGTWF